MTHEAPAQTARRRTRALIVLAALVAVSAVLVAIFSAHGLVVTASSGPTPQPSETVDKLDPQLRRALRQAETDAARDRVQLQVNSGWRSRTYQERLFREAVAKYGSKAEAARWVAVPGTSAHERGDAVDLGPSAATVWLSEHGAAYGLCQIYRNEPWHYELRPRAVDRGCPRMYADSSQSPKKPR